MASHCVGLTFPGMMDEPGSLAGRINSPNPLRGPEAAAVGIPHPKWDERPVLVVVAREGKEPPADEIIELLRPHFATWQLPDDVIYVDEIPHTATGKISKLELRQVLDEMGYQLPDQRGAG